MELKILNETMLVKKVTDWSDIEVNKRHSNKWFVIELIGWVVALSALIGLLFAVI